MTIARSLTLGLVLSSALALWLWVTAPRSPNTTVVGTTPPAHEMYPQDAMQPAYLAQLRSLAGTNARECGVLHLNDNSLAAISCGIESLSKHAPFWLVVELGGTDTTTWVGLAHDAKSGQFQLVWLRDIWSGGEILPPERCNSLSFNIAAPFRGDLFHCTTGLAP